MGKRLKCGVCKKMKPTESTFIYENEKYCFDCSCELIHRLCDMGHLYMDCDDMEEKGIRMNT